MNLRRLLLPALVLATGLLVLPSSASAAVYCVGPGVGCFVAPFSQDSAGITAAITTANNHPGDDVVTIAAGAYAISSSAFPALAASPDRLWINGAGAGQTILNGTSDGTAPLIDLELPNADSALNGVTLNVSFTSNFAYGVVVKRGQFNEFAVNQTGTVSNGAPASAIDLRGGTRAYGGTVSNAGNASGLSLHDGQTYVQRVSLTGSGAGAGVYVSGGADASMTSLRIVNYGTGLRVDSGSVEITDSLVDMQGASGVTGFYVNDQNAGVTSNIDVDASRNTIIGSGSSIGIYLNTQEIADTSTGSYNDMLIYGTNPGFTSWLCSGPAGGGPAIDFQGLASNVAPAFGANCAANALAPAPLTLTESPFVDFAARKLRPAWDSPIVDAGSTTAQAWANDLDDGSHRVDGDNDGIVTSDIGAFEYQADPPIGAISAPGTAAVGQTIGFSHSMADPDPTNSVAGVVWDFGDGATSAQAAPAHAYSAAGDYTVTVSATNLAGSVGTATARIVVPVVPANRPDAAPPTAKIASKPKKSFKIGRAGFAVAKKGAVSFSARFTGAAKARFTLQSLGKKRKLKSLKGSQLFTLPQTSAPVKFSFAGRWNRKTLTGGNYRVTITPVSVAGVSGKPATVDIKLKK